MSNQDKYEKICDIGKGSFGCVSKIKRKADGKILVWKELNYGKMSEKEKQMIVSEVNILRELSHPNIVRYYDRIIDREQAKIYIVMEYCEGGDIATLIKNHKKTKDYIPEEIVWSVLAQMLQALGSCHNRKEGKILHRDLKPGNIFLDKNQNVKLGDFGLSRVMNQDSVFAYTHVGTPYYMSPEQINDQKYNEKSDIWSTGCIIYEVAALRAPFEATTHYQLAMKIKSGKLDRIPSTYTDDLWRVITSMIQQDPDRRPSVDMLQQHPQIQVRVKEHKLRQYRENLKRKEYEMQKRLHVIKEKEQEIQRRQAELKDKEERLKALEKQIEEQEEEQKRQILSAQQQNNINLNGTLNNNNIIGSVRASMQNSSHVNNNLENESGNLQCASKDGGVEQVKVNSSFKSRRGSFKQALEDITNRFENQYLK